MSKQKKGSQVGTERSHADEIAQEKRPIRKFLKILGPGLITGASDDDPSGIGTYSVAGASTGFATLWTVILTLPMMIAVQYICAKIGKVSGEGLATLLRKRYHKAMLYPVVFALGIANTINAGVDIGAIGAAVNLLVPIHVTIIIIPVVAIILVIQIWGSYRTIESIFKWLTLAVLSYIGAAFFARPDLMEVLRGTFIPRIILTHDYLQTIVALLGTTISPYLFFWQAAHEVEEDVSQGKKTARDRRGATKQELRYTFWDVSTGMILSNLVSYFIIMATGATLFAAGHTHIETADQAALALRPIAGAGAEILFALGMIGSGFLAVPILTGSAAYAFAGAFQWRQGLSRKPNKARKFYIVIACSTVIGMLLNFSPIKPITALFWTAIINGFLASPMLAVIMILSNNKEIMGEKVNGPVANILGWMTTALMFAAAVATLIV